MVWEKTGADRAIYATTVGFMAGIGAYSIYKAYYWIFPKI